LVGAPNYAPSLRSVAGLLLALVLKSRYGDPLRLPYKLYLELPRNSIIEWGLRITSALRLAQPTSRFQSPVR
jgi:hypothetical protein